MDLESGLGDYDRRVSYAAVSISSPRSLRTCSSICSLRSICATHRKAYGLLEICYNNALLAQKGNEV